MSTVVSISIGDENYVPPPKKKLKGDDSLDMYSASNYKPIISAEERAIQESIIEKAEVEKAAGKQFYFDQLRKFFDDTKVLHRHLVEELTISELMERCFWLNEVSITRAFISFTKKDF